MLEEKDKKKLYNLCTKISYVFTDFYVLKNGYIMSIDKEKPFVIQIDDNIVKLFKDLSGEFTILHIWDVKNFKKDMDNYIAIVTSNTEQRKVINNLKEKIEYINKCTKWENFVLSDNETENEKLILSLFKNNDYLTFKPKDNTDGPEIILTKSLLPLVSEKNYTDLFYSSMKLDSSVYLIVFDFQFDLFRLYMLHHYIPIDNK